MAAARVLRGAPTAVVGLVLVGVLLGSYAIPDAGANHQPANKVVASGNKVIEFSQAVSAGAPAAQSQEVVLLTGALRSNKPSDAIISVALECAISASSSISGTGATVTTGDIDVWVEIDGERVGVNNIGTSTTSSEPADNGEVTFCNRQDFISRGDSTGDDSEVELRDALYGNAFNWVTLNIGNGVHTIEVIGRLTAAANSTAGESAIVTAFVGRRTLVVEPEKLANDASV